MRSFAHWLAKDNIRVNTVHPTGVETPIIMNEGVGSIHGREPASGRSDRKPTSRLMLQPADISDASFGS